MSHVLSRALVACLPLLLSVWLASVPAAARVHQTRPIAEFEPVERVVAHMQLTEVDPVLLAALQSAFSWRLLVEDLEPPGFEEGEDWDRAMLWVRDYWPLHVRRGRTLVALRYLALNPNRSEYAPLLIGADEVSDGRTHLPEPQVETLPLLHENGNLVTDGRWVFVTEALVFANTVEHDEPHLRARGYHARSGEETIAVLAEAMGVSPANVVVLPPMPDEATGHVDLFLMPIAPGRVMIPEIRPEALLAREVHESADLARGTRAFLDAQAARLRTLGIRVERLPMVAPRVVPFVDEPERGFSTVFFTPANGLLARTPEAATVLLPGFGRALTGGARAGLQARYQIEWRARFRGWGWRARFVDSTALGPYLGLLRCVTGTIPRGS